MSLLEIPPLALSLPHGMDPTRLRLAYGHRAIPKLVHELGINEKCAPEDDHTFTEVVTDPDDVGLSNIFVRQRALVSLSNLLRNPENLVQALNANILPKLAQLIMDEDIIVRQKATELLMHFAGHAVGRRAIVQHEMLPILAGLLLDVDVLTRTNAYQVFFRVTSQKACVLALAANQEISRSLPDPSILDTTKVTDVPPVPTKGYIPVLVNKLVIERAELQCLSLGALYNLVRFHQGFAVEALQVNGVSVLTDILRDSHALAANKCAAANALMALSFYPDGKRLACKEHSIPVLVGLLMDRQAEVRAAAAGALMSITVDVEGKRIMVRDSFYEPLIELLDDGSDAVKLNVIKTITHCAEDYRGRFAFQRLTKKLKEFEGNSNPHLKDAASKAIEVILWRP